MSKMLKAVAALCFLGLAMGGPPVMRSREDIEKFKDFLESSRTEDGVILEDRMKLVPNASVWENSGKYQGDILLDDWQVDAMLQQYSLGRHAMTLPNTRWPGNTVVYEFAAGAFTQEQRNAIIQSINDIQRNSCVRFRLRRAGENNFVRLTDRRTGCYAHVGFWASRGVHTMNLAPATPGQGCFNRVVIIHEWLHILGFFHMHSTYTRDNYIIVNWQNIIRGQEFAFERMGRDIVSNLNLPYEFTSCMHYGPFAFSSNRQPTITARRSFSGQMGQTSFVTANDWLRLRRHYSC